MKALKYWIVALIIGVSFSCNRENGQAPEKEKAQAKKERKPYVKGEYTDQSVYNLESEWVTQSGDTVELGDFGGKVQVVAMIFTSCQYACPRIVADMQNINDKMPDKYNDEVNFLLVSIDPETDKPPVLREFAEKMELDTTRWTLLHGPDQNVVELAAVLDVKYKKVREAAFSHSNIITVLNRQGEVVHQSEGLENDPKPTLEAIEELM